MDTLALWVRPGSSTSPRKLVVVNNRRHNESPALVFQATQAHFQKADTVDFTGLSHLKDIYGCLGLYAAAGDLFLTVVTSCTRIASPLGCEIYSITGVKFFSLHTSRYDQQPDVDLSSVSNTKTLDISQHPCFALEKLLANSKFYFSPTYPLTRTLQSLLALLQQKDPSFRFPFQKVGNKYRMQLTEETSPWRTYDSRFLWNRFLLRDLKKFKDRLPMHEQIHIERDSLLVMVIQGYIEQRSTIASHSNFPDVQIALLSRLSCERAGTRFNTRGIDDTGHVANAVETEQIMHVGDKIFSFVVVRGSVPVFWEQKMSNIGIPRFVLTRDSHATQPAFVNHFNHLLDLHSQVTVVNLLAERGSEMALSESYKQHIQLLKNSHVHYVHFDFNAYCSGSDYQRLAILLNRLMDDIHSYNYFLYDITQGESLLLQNGTFRVNCLDCLDRTNVVQSLISTKVMEHQWKTWAFSESNLSVDLFFRKLLGDMWADNGDIMAMIYAGTGAMKSSYTRAGRRTLSGLMDDAKKAVNRLYVNAFIDPERQQTIDLLLGNSVAFNANQSGYLTNPVQDAFDQKLQARKEEYETLQEMTLLVHTWNVAGSQPSKEDLRLLFRSDKGIEGTPDICIIGLQELVMLTPDQVMSTDPASRVVWEESLLNTLNSLSPTVEYMLVRSEQMVGCVLMLFVQRIHLPRIKGVFGACKKTGMKGMAGNKGGVALRFDFQETSFCFVCAHFTAGQVKLDERNRDFQTINQGILFDYGKTIANHENIIWLGDFNYRVDLPMSEIISAIQRKDWRRLLAYDQLCISRERGLSFPFFTEGDITFPPTYKYDIGTNRFDTSDERRIPAWTDRILYYGTRIQQVAYTSISSLLRSDHKPVQSTFVVTVRQVDGAKLKTIEKEILQEISQSGLVEMADVYSVKPSDELLADKMGAIDLRGTLQEKEKMPRQPPPLPPRKRMDPPFMAASSESEMVSSGSATRVTTVKVDNIRSDLLSREQVSIMDECDPTALGPFSAKETDFHSETSLPMKKQLTVDELLFGDEFEEKKEKDMPTSPAKQHRGYPENLYEGDDPFS